MKRMWSIINADHLCHRYLGIVAELEASLNILQASRSCLGYMRPLGSFMNTLCHLLCDICAKENYMGYLEKEKKLFYCTLGLDFHSERVM